MTAKLEHVSYSTLRKPVVIVRCDECHVVLNSGHHYRALDLAQKTADEHDEECHS